MTTMLTFFSLLLVDYEEEEAEDYDDNDMLCDDEIGPTMAIRTTTTMQATLITMCLILTCTYVLKGIQRSRDKDVGLLYFYLRIHV